MFMTTMSITRIILTVNPAANVVWVIAVGRAARSTVSFNRARPRLDQPYGG